MTILEKSMYKALSEISSITTFIDSAVAAMEDSTNDHQITWGSKLYPRCIDGTQKDAAGGAVRAGMIPPVPEKRKEF